MALRPPFSDYPNLCAFNLLRPLPDILVARHGIEPYPLAFQTSTLPSSSRAGSFAAKYAAQDFACGLPLRSRPQNCSTLVDGARLELAFHGCRPWVMPLYEPPNWGEMRESNSRGWSHNPVPKPFGQSRHRIWSCWLDSHQHRPATRQVPLCVGHSSKTSELVRSLELRTGASSAPALPVELYQRSWRGDSNADHGLTRPALFPLSYTSANLLCDNWLRGHDSNVHEPGQSGLSWPIG